MSKPLPTSSCTIHLLISPEVVALPVQSPIKFGAGSKGQSGHHAVKLRPTLVASEMNVLPQAVLPNPLMGATNGTCAPRRFPNALILWDAEFISMYPRQSVLVEFASSKITEEIFLRSPNRALEYVAKRTTPMAYLSTRARFSLSNSASKNWSAETVRTLDCFRSGRFCPANLKMPFTQAVSKAVTSHSKPITCLENFITSWNPTVRLLTHSLSV